MPLVNPVQPPELLLGSASPRRKELLERLGLQFEIVLQQVEETYPDHLRGHQITDYLCQKKSDSLQNRLRAGTVLLTADTIVWHRDTVLEKPGSLAGAKASLRKLSGQSHDVITSVCFRSLKENLVLHELTRVEFDHLSEADIDTYCKVGNPLDKAGAYGIQEWIGLVGVKRIDGSYTNVVGLPTRLVYKTLRTMASRGF